MTDGATPAKVRLTDGLGIAVDADTECADPMREAMRRFTTPPRKGAPAADLTEGERLALCIAAGAPTETTMEGGFLTVRTTVPCGVADRGDGGYIVAVGARPNVRANAPTTACVLSEGLGLTVWHPVF